MNTLVILPVLIPLLTGAGLLLAGPRAGRLPHTAGTLAVLLQLAVAVALAYSAGTGPVLAYLAGNWQAPFGIALAADRLAALLLILTAILALASLLAERDEPPDDAGAGRRQGIFQLQLFGLNGAFLTTDVFNLFVFFEVLLCASYALLIRGRGDARFPVAIQYVVVNLLASALFLVAVAVLYGVTGTLNLADLAVRMAALPATELPLARSGVYLLLSAFAVKAALLPVGFWLPATYRLPPVAVSVLFVLMTKVGIYGMLRVASVVTVLPGTAGDGLLMPALLPLALATLALATFGTLAARDLRTLASHLVVASAGTLLVAVAVGGEAVVAAGLFYLAHSTLGTALLFAVAGRLTAERPGQADRLLATGRTPVRASTAGYFLLAATGIAGLPPLAGFVAKAGLVDALLSEGPAPATSGGIVALLLVSSLLTLLALARAGSNLFWKSAGEVAAPAPPMPRGDPARGASLAAALLLAAWVALSAAPGPLVHYARAAAGQLLLPAAYVDAVLGELPVTAPAAGGAPP